MTQTFEGWKIGKNFKKLHWYESCWDAAYSAGRESRSTELAEKDRRIAELEARIEAGKALAEEWESGGMHEEAYDVGREQCAKEIRAVLGEPVSKP